jgi:precorrin-6A/cobalt-precorrin-6A reductase
MLIRPVLILGGTAEARELAELLIERDFSPITSLAGVTSDPILPPGKIREGGFGGVQAMVRFLNGGFFVAVADASHPFAVKISTNAMQAAKNSGLPYLRLERPTWTPTKPDNWIEVSSIEEAARAIPSGAHILLTTGRKELSPFLSRIDISGIIRTIESPSNPLPANWKLHRDRPPYDIESEIALMTRENVTLLVTKNSGSDSTRAKLEAAREKKIPVIMVKRPPKPEAPTFWPPKALADHLAAAFKT